MEMGWRWDGDVSERERGGEVGREVGLREERGEREEWEGGKARREGREGREER
jgi:hypothetical protein